MQFHPQNGFHQLPIYAKNRLKMPKIPPKTAKIIKNGGKWTKMVANGQIVC